MKKIVILVVIFFVNFLLTEQVHLGEKSYEMRIKVDKMTWQTNLTKKEVNYVKEAIKNKDIMYYEGLFKIVVSHDLVALSNVIQSLEKKWEYLKIRRTFLLNYLNSKSKIDFIKKKLKEKLPDDDAWKNSYHRRPPLEYFRSMLHSVLLSKQVRYNEINKRYSEHLIKDILLKIKSKQYGIDKSYQKWLAHKAKAKKAGWPAVDGAKY